MWTKSDKPAGNSRPKWLYSKLSSWKLREWNDVYTVPIRDITCRFTECFCVRVCTWNIFKRRFVYFAMSTWNVR